MIKNLKLRSLPALLLVVALLASAIIMTQTTPAFAINTPWLHVSGNKLMDPSNNVVILRGVDLPDLHVVANHGRTASQLIDLATNSASGWYAHVVRLAVYPDAIDSTAGWNAGPDAYF